VQASPVRRLGHRGREEEREGGKKFAGRESRCSEPPTCLAQGGRRRRRRKGIGVPSAVVASFYLRSAVYDKGRRKG